MLTPIAAPHDEKFDVVVTYNGKRFEENIPPTQAAQAVFEKAVRFFEVESSAASLGLFFGGNPNPLNLQASLASQGVPSGAAVVLQPRRVGNGAM